MKTNNLKNILTIIVGALIFSIGIEFFANPNNIVTGGATGLSIILSTTLENIIGKKISIGLLTILINIPIFVISLAINGTKFVKQSTFATLAISFWLFVLNKTPNIFNINGDIFIATILTGVLCGTGIGLILKIGASSGGTDMLSNSIYKIFPKFAIHKIIFTIDTLIVTFGFFIFGPTKTSYSIIAIFLSAKIINNILGGLRFARAVLIVSDKTEEISTEIFKQLKRGNTKIKCTGMYTKKDKNLLLIVVWPKEIIKLKDIIYKKDKKAFVIICPAQEVIGNFLKY